MDRVAEEPGETHHLIRLVRREATFAPAVRVARAKPSFPPNDPARSSCCRSAPTRQIISPWTTGTTPAKDSVSPPRHGAQPILPE
jgi:hypothetical protein